MIQAVGICVALTGLLYWRRHRYSWFFITLLVAMLGICILGHVRRAEPMRDEATRYCETRASFSDVEVPPFLRGNRALETTFTDRFCAALRRD